MSEHGEPRESAELRRLRRRIDTLDRRIVALLNERARLALAVGAAKVAEGGRSVRDARREQEVLERVVMLNEGPLTDEELSSLYRRLFATTRSLQSAARRTGHTRGSPVATDRPGPTRR